MAIFFPCRDFYLKSRIFSHVEIFIASREFFFLSRIFSCQGISVQVEILIFSSQDFFSCRDLSIQVDIFQFKARVIDVCLDSLLVFPALNNHVIYGGKHHGGR